MTRRIGLSLFVVIAALSSRPFKAVTVADGPACASDQRLDSTGRHREMIARARVINTRLAQQRRLSDHYLTAADLGLKNENGFEISLRSDAAGYMFFILDTTDPCHSAVFSDERGIIYDAQPLR